MVSAKIAADWSSVPRHFGTKSFWVFFFSKTQFFSHFWPSNEFLVFIKSKPLMSRSFSVYLQPSRGFLWEVVVVWSSDARDSWKFLILQISQNMKNLANWRLSLISFSRLRFLSYNTQILKETQIKKFLKFGTIGWSRAWDKTLFLYCTHEFMYKPSHDC